LLGSYFDITKKDCKVPVNLSFGLFDDSSIELAEQALAMKNERP
jgi:hypothetical protein